jgi:hypothetical protein
MYALSLGVVGRIVGIVYMSGVSKASVRFGPTKNRATLDAYYQRLTINLAPTQMSVGMA